MSLPTKQSPHLTSQDADDHTAQPIGDARSPISVRIRKATEINEITGYCRGTAVQFNSPNQTYKNSKHIQK